jgi:hypothetical protein
MPDAARRYAWQIGSHNKHKFAVSSSSKGMKCVHGRVSREMNLEEENLHGTQRFDIRRLPFLNLKINKQR